MPTCPTCHATVIRAKAPHGFVSLDTAAHAVYVLPVRTPRPNCTRAHQGLTESISAGVQYQYLAAHVCARATEGKK